MNVQKCTTKVSFRPLLKGVYIMATKSVLKSIHIRDKRAAERLVSALEHAAEKGSKQVLRTRMFSDANRDEIRKMFGAKQ